MQALNELPCTDLENMYVCVYVHPIYMAMRGTLRVRRGEDGRAPQDRAHLHTTRLSRA